MGMVLVDATSGCADGVPMATITSGLSPTNFLAIWPAVPALPWALWNSHLKPLPASKPSALSSSRVPSRTASSAGCSTMEVASTALSAASTGALQSAARASAALAARHVLVNVNIFSPLVMPVYEKAPLYGRWSASELFDDSLGRLDQVSRQGHALFLR